MGTVLDKFIGTDVPLGAFIFTILTTLVVSWMPQIRGFFKERQEKKEEQEKQEKMRKVMRIELLESYYALNMNLEYEGNSEMEYFIESQHELDKIIPIINQQQGIAKQLDFEYFKTLHIIKRKIYLYIQKGVDADIVTDEHGEIKSYYQKTPEKWLDEYKSIKNFFKELEEEVNSF